MNQTELQTVPVPAVQHSISDIQKIGEVIAASKLFGVSTPEQAIALCLIAHAEGRHPATAAMDYDIIQGRPALKSKSLLARFQEAGGSVVWNDYTDEKVSGTFSHPQGGTVTVEWDNARVKAAGLDNRDMHKKYPRQMKRARVISEAVLTIWPGAASFYTPEEVADFDEPKVVEPTSVSKPKGRGKAKAKPPIEDPVVPPSTPEEPAAPPENTAEPPAETPAEPSGDDPKYISKEKVAAIDGAFETNLDISHAQLVKVVGVDSDTWTEAHKSWLLVQYKAIGNKENPLTKEAFLDSKYSDA